MPDGDSSAAPSAAAGTGRLDLDFYGLRLGIQADWPDVLDDLRLDFWWFERPSAEGSAAVEVTVERRAPDYDVLGDGAASFVTPRNVVYQQDGRTVVDYFGRAVSILDRARSQLLVQGTDEHLVHEAVYQFVLSTVGQHLDACSLPRLHSLSIVGGQGAVAVMLPSGGGKSTLALRALQHDDVRFIAEDTAVVDSRGRLHPFPLRMAVNTTDAALVPGGSGRRIERMEFHPKLALDPGLIADRIEREPQPLRHLVIGQRSLGRAADLAPLPRRAALGTLLREGIVGVGVYQGMEFILQRGMRDVAGKTGVLATRARCFGAALARAQVWRLVLGRDHERNWEALARLL